MVDEEQSRKRDLDEISNYFGKDTADIISGAGNQKKEDAQQTPQAKPKVDTNTDSAQHYQDSGRKQLSKKSLSRSTIVIMLSVVAVAIILAAAYLTGVNGLANNKTSGTVPVTTCNAIRGYFCGLAAGAYNYVNNQLSITVGQDTGNDLHGVAVAYAPSGAAVVNGTPDAVFAGVPGLVGGTLSSYQAVTVVVKASSANAVQLGTKTSGSVWLAFSYSPNVTSCATPVTGVIAAGCQALRIANLTAEAQAQ